MTTRRARIQQWAIDQRTAARLINRLMAHVMCDGMPAVPEEGAAVVSLLMNDSQVRAALGILKKYLPDLKAIEHSGNPDRPVITQIKRTIVDPARRDPAPSADA